MSIEVDLGKGGVLEASMAAPVLPPLDWRTGEVHLEVAFEGKVRSFRFHGSFARLGAGDRCEIKIPNLGAPVTAYLQIGNGYLAIVELSTTVDLPRGEIQYLLPGGSVWLMSNARLTLESIRLEQTVSEAFSWESFDMEDLRVLPNTLVLESVQSKPDSKENQFRLISAISVLGTHAACQLQLKHRSVAAFQCVLFRGEHVGQPVRVVDLLAPIPTQVGGRIANGEVLNVGSRLQCGKMVFSAKRLFYDSPAGYVSSLPGMEKLKTRASEDGGLQPEIVLQDGVPAMDLPGLQVGWPTNAGWLHSGGEITYPAVVVQSFSEQSLLPPSGAEDVGLRRKEGMEDQQFGLGDRPGSVSALGVPSNGVIVGREHAEIQNGDRQSVAPPTTVWEESIERSQADIVATLQAMASRIDSLEQTLQSLPAWMDRVPAILQDCIARAATAPVATTSDPGFIRTSNELDRGHRVTEEQTADGAETDAVATRSGATLVPSDMGHVEAAMRSNSPSLPLSTSSSATTPSSPLVSGFVPVAHGRSDAGDRSQVVGSRGVGAASPQPQQTASHGTSRKSRRKESRMARRAPSVASTGSSTSGDPTRFPAEVLRIESQPVESEKGKDLHRLGLATEAREVPSDPIGLSNRSVGRLDSGPNGQKGAPTLDPDRLLAASDSPGETLVLGSLIGLRQKKEDVRWFRLKVMLAVGTLLVLILGVYAWDRIPEGWRNLIWDSFARWFTRDSVD